jgi:arabinofuranosyltransferase
MRIDPQSRRTYEVLVPLAGATLLCILGWRLFWFLADDAFILFRYVSNAHLGFGYVWNAPPFKPVEGYSCFLWVALLDLVWRVFGVAPPQSTNVLSLFLTLATLGLGAVMVLRVTLPSPLERHRPLILGLALLWITTNRTFLAWSSSGLETALFNLLLTGWVCAGLFPAKPGLRRDLPIAMLAAALALTRPDGLLFVVATIAILILHSRERWRILSFAPLLTVPVHLIEVQFSLAGERDSLCRLVHS